MLRSGQVVKISETTSAAAAAALEEESKCDRCGSQDGVIGGGANDYFINLCKRCFDKDAAGSKISKAVG
jgi:ribosomal protein S14